MARGSFLQDSEREYLWSEGYYVDHKRVTTDVSNRECNASEKQAKSRINNEVTDDLRGIIRQFRKDLQAIIRYNNSREGGWAELEGSVLPKSENEMKHLQKLLNGLIEKTERDLLPRQRTDLAEGVAELGIGVEQEGELERRKEALAGVLRKQQLVDVVEYLDEQGKTTLDKDLRGTTGRFLVNEFGLVDRDDTWQNHKGYSLTERGQAVSRAWDRLKETEVVDEFTIEDSDRTPRAIIRYFLNIHFESEEWTDTLENVPTELT